MSWEIREGHALTLLKAMPDESIHGVITSPPYFSLRWYRTEPQIWGGDPHCQHEWGSEHIKSVRPQRDSASGSFGTTRGLQARRQGMAFTASQGQVCQHCGAWRGELGLEPTPELYVQHLVEVFREVKRVLRSDGVMFLNTGDSFWGGKGRSGQGSPESQARRQDRSLNKPHQHIGGQGLTRPQDGRHDTLKPKDLCGIPWRVAFALQADGWWLRSAITLCKLNPMPESVRDRPTSATEMMFLLTRSARYFYDQEAVREPHLPSSLKRYKYGHHANAPKDGFISAGSDTGVFHSERMGDWVNPTGRNIRNWWIVTTEAFPHGLVDDPSQSHFATSGQKWIEPCIRAGTSEQGCCANCGALWEREIKVSRGTIGQDWNQNKRGHKDGEDIIKSPKIDKRSRDGTYQRKTVGWHPTCSCHADPVPATVLDPFTGSGTTGVVALKLGRSVLGLELQPAYVEMARKRLGAVMPLFA